MNKNSLIVVLCFCASIFSLKAQKMMDLDVFQAPKKGDIYTVCGETKWGVLVFSSNIPGLQFSLSLPDNLNNQVYRPERNEYVLCVEPTDRRYVVTATCSDCDPVNYTVENIRENDPQFFRITRKHTPPDRQVAKYGELSFYYAGGFENVAAPEHEDIPVIVVYRKKIPETSTYKDKNGQTKTTTITKNEDTTIGSGTLMEGFSVKMNDPRSDKDEVIIRVKEAGLFGNVIELFKNSTTMGDAIIKHRTIKLRNNMPNRDIELTVKKSQKTDKKGRITYTYELVVR